MSNMYGGGLPSNSSGANANKYQTNIGRTKTKKWVQASVPNYDGDDWGNDYDEQPEPEPEPPHSHTAHQQTWPQQQHPSSLAPGLGSRPLLPSKLPWLPPSARNMSGSTTSLPSQGQPQPGPANRSDALPAESDQSLQERRSFTTGTADDAIRTEPARSSSPLATASIPTAPPGSGPSSLPSSARERLPQDVARTASPPTASPGGQTSAPQSPATRFPPRKSSMGHKDGPPPNMANFGPLLQRGSSPGSKPTSPSRANNQRPWMEARSGSPQGPRSPPQTGKPLPFVRPADIYKRLEEEKEKERRSLDSARPSLDGLGQGSGGDYRVGSPGARSDSPDRAQRTNLGKDSAEGDATPRGPRSQAGLATVAERTSEYGLDDYYTGAGLLPETDADTSDEAKKQSLDAATNASSNTAQTVPASVPAPATAMTSVAAPLAPVSSVLPQQGRGGGTGDNLKMDTSNTNLLQPRPAQQQQPAPDDNSSVAESDEDDIRRFSTSPVLPDFSRMSSFGVDMFGSAFSPPEEPQPSLTAISEQQLRPPVERNKGASPLSQVQQSSTTPAASSASTTPTPGPQGAASTSSPPTDTDRHAAETSGPAPDAGTAAQATAKDRSDTPLSSTSALPAAPESRELAASAPPRQVDEAGVVKPSVVKAKVGATRSPVTAQSTEKQPGPAEDLADSRTKLKSRQGTTEEDVQLSASSKEDSRSSTPRETMAGTLPPVSSRSRSQSPSKVQAMIQAMNQANAKAAGVPQQSSKVSSSATPPVTTAAPQAPATTAPAAPQRASPGPPEVESLEPVTRASTFTTMATESPVKESDKLREEIMLSLSPHQGGREFAGSKKPDAEAPSSGVPRESTYLGDVYDDYYGGPDDSTEEPISDKAADDKVDGTAANDASSSSAPMPKLGQGLGDVPPLNPSSMSPRPLSPRKSQPSVQIPALKHRFSWEMGAEEANSPTAAKPSFAAPAAAASTETPPDQSTAHEPEPKSLSIVPPAQPPAQPPSSRMGSPLSPVKSGSDASPVVTGAAGAAGAASISHSVSEASTLPSGKLLPAIELPSPLSIRSDEQNKPMTEGLPARTLAEEKSLMTSASSPVSAPPREEHPALSETPAVASAPAAEERAVSSGDTTPTPTGPTQTAPTPATTGAVSTATAPTPTTATPTGTRAAPQSPTTAPASPIPAKIATFKDIMALPTAAERIDKLDETRDIFAKIDSGLDAWLVAASQAPGNANASWSLKDSITNEMLAGGQKTGPTAHQPGLPGHSHTGKDGGPRPVSGLALGSHLTAADLRHSGKEVGAKGKELLMAGGKAAKGLFSKGRSKFRAFDR
ncbi:hypothetical protein MAPG_10434 [Magnaporthiopsis poae ATCC 64411]|uniref:Uncharacterized protein n=1 Tax=Magnaporthiopsis poae (strain ATCC 64411 / 73-15) TaxID=644358 RepID=A0A0C4ECK5_MAGP6|nr:hypothetical protein MAPG_10434 [Magnaporthiopsis poae ATCC 64411]